VSAAPARPLPPSPPPPPPARPARFRFRAPRTVRLRLTLLYVGLFLASAACLLVITYFLVARQLPGTVALRTSAGGTAGTSGTVITGGGSAELRTPLARQRTLLEVALRDKQASNASLRTACERALAAGEQQERLIASLLTLARGERGLAAFEPFGLDDVAAGALAARLDEADARGVTVSADLGPARALGDAGLAEQLAANLADNAIRYNVTGGRVEISTGDRDGRAFLAVSNTGPVIPPDQLGRLFQPFQRLDPGRTVRGGGERGNGPNGAGPGRGGGGGPEGGGLGLGLAIVSAIAAAHGAELHAVTRAAGGLAVEVVFPPVPAGSGHRAEERAPALA